MYNPQNRLEILPMDTVISLPPEIINCSIPGQFNKDTVHHKKEMHV